MDNKSVKSIGERLAALRAQGDEKAADATDSHVSADGLISDIETRWGPGFAQWVADGLKDPAQ